MLNRVLRSLGRNREQLFVAAIAGLAVLLVFVPEAFAAGANMPWEAPLRDVEASLKGPVARIVGIIAIVVTGLAFALGEGGPMFKKSMGVLFGLSIAFMASTLLSMLGFGGGALI